MAMTMSETVVPATAPQARHQARVVANLCRILSRELGAQDDVSTSTKPSVIDDRSLVTCDDATAAAAHAELVAAVRKKLAINKPGYDQHDAVQERAIVQ